MKRTLPKPFDLNRNRFRAMWNGVIIGSGIGYLIFGEFLFGLFFIVTGVGVEYWQRQKLKR